MFYQQTDSGRPVASAPRTHNISMGVVVRASYVSLSWRKRILFPEFLGLP